MASYQQMFRMPNFRRFWIGFTFSVIGDALTRVALTWFVYSLTHSALALGWLMLCFTGPIVIGGLVAGWLLDRFDRRMVMIIDNLVRGCAVSLIPLLHALGRLELWHIYLVALIYGLFMMIALAGGPTLIPSLVRSDQLALANALEMLSFTIGGVIGPVLAGLLIGLISAPNVILIDMLSYFTYALLLSRITLEPARPTAPGQRPYHLGHAVQLLIGNPILLSTTLMFLVFNIGGGMLAVWLPILADRWLGGGAELYGLLLGMLAGGEVLSAMLVGNLRLSLALGLRICLTQLLSGLALMLLLLSQNIWVVGASLLLYGVFSAPLTIWAQTLRMRIIPEQLRGRSFALLRMLMQSGNPLGGTLAGAILPLLGIPIVIGLSAILVGLPGLFGIGVSALRHDRVQ